MLFAKVVFFTEKTMHICNELMKKMYHLFLLTLFSSSI